MPVRNVKSYKGKIQFPVEASPQYKITIERDDETLDTLTPDILSATALLSGTTELGSFSIELDNNQGQYTGLYDGGEYLNIYLDYIDATTLYFRGRVDGFKYKLNWANGFTLMLYGRDYPEIADETETIQFTNTDLIHALVGVSGDADAQGMKSDGVLYNTGLTWHSSNPSDDDNNTTITKSYTDQKKLNILKDISQRGGYSWYIYYDESATTWYIRMFETGTVKNSIDSVAYGSNLENVSGFGKDYQDEFNRIRVYGEEDDNVFYLKTTNNTTSQTNLWVKDKKVTDSKINNKTERDDRSTYELANNVTTEEGSMTVLPLVSLRPGEQIMTIIPYCGMNDYYTIRTINTRLNYSGFRSTLDIETASDSVAKLFKETHDENEATLPYVNLNDMDNTYLVDFSADPGGDFDSNKTEIEDNKLKLTTPGAGQTGSWESVDETASVGVTKFELRAKANYDIDASTFQVSGDSGYTWTSAVLGILYEPGNIGTGLRIKVNLSGTTDEPNPKIEKICLLYS